MGTVTPSRPWAGERSNMNVKEKVREILGLSVIRFSSDAAKIVSNDCAAPDVMRANLDALVDCIEADVERAHFHSLAPDALTTHARTRLAALGITKDTLYPPEPIKVGDEVHWGGETIYTVRFIDDDQKTIIRRRNCGTAYLASLCNLTKVRP